MRKMWYGVKIFVENEEKRKRLLLEHIKPFKEEFLDRIESYHFFRYTSGNDKYIRFRLFGDEDDINNIQNDIERRLNQLIDSIIICYEREPYNGEDLDELYEYGSEAFYAISDFCLRFPEDQRFTQFYQKVQRLLHLFFNPLGFDYFGENKVCLDKIFSNLQLMDTHPEIGSRGATQIMLNEFQSIVEYINNHYRERGYEVRRFEDNV